LRPFPTRRSSDRELRRLELRARVSTGLFQFGKNIFYGGKPEALIGEFGRRDTFESALLSHDLPGFGLDLCQYALDDRVGFRVDRRRVQRIVAVGHPQESCCLLEGLVAETWDFEQGLAIGKGAMFIAPADYVLGH